MTAQELENRLLNIIISVDAPDLETQNKDLLSKCVDDYRSLYQTEDKILDVLSITNSNILEDETALRTLDDSKVSQNEKEKFWKALHYSFFFFFFIMKNLLEEIRLKQKKSSLAEETLRQAYTPYKKISTLTTRIFFSLRKLKALNSFYEFSYRWFVSLFLQVKIFYYSY